MHIRSFLGGPIVGKSKPLKTQSLLKLSVYQKKDLCTSIKDTYVVLLWNLEKD